MLAGVREVQKKQDKEYQVITYSKLILPCMPTKCRHNLQAFFFPYIYTFVDSFPSPYLFILGENNRVQIAVITGVPQIKNMQKAHVGSQRILLPATTYRNQKGLTRFFFHLISCTLPACVKRSEIFLFIEFLI